MGNEKLKYEKPLAIDMGGIAPISGAGCYDGVGADGNCDTGGTASIQCSTGNGDAASGCVVGEDPHLVPTCNPGGTATSNCTDGSIAGELCWPGSDANVACVSGGIVGP